MAKNMSCRLARWSVASMRAVGTHIGRDDLSWSLEAPWPGTAEYYESMADFMSSEQRSAHMSKIRSKNTKPELVVRRAVHAAGYRYRLHDKRLPGKPDLVFAGRKKVIFVNGCFWHGHSCPIGTRLPKSNTSFWLEKRQRNQNRDAQQREELQELGWKVLDIWECEVGEKSEVLDAVRKFLDPHS